MRTIIFGSTRKRAYDKLDEIVKYLTPDIIDRIIKYEQIYEIQMKNGDSFCAVLGNEDAIGYRCDVAYIDTKLEIGDLIYRIEPMIMPKNENNYFYF